jgi:hypothetical protein
MRAREAGMITGRPARTGVRPVALGAALLAATLCSGCSRDLEVSMSSPQTVTATAAGTDDAAPETSAEPSAESTAEPSDGTTGPDAATPEQPAPEVTGSTSRAAGGKKAAWGGGTRVGTYPTRGTVTGDDGTDRQIRSVSGTCELAHDVRTATVTVQKGAVLVVHVTGPNVAEITLTVEGEPTRSVEYVGDATPVITLTPRRTEVRAALLVPPAGSTVPPVRIDASLDC